MNSSKLLGSLLFAAVAASGCDNAKPPVSTPPTEPAPSTGVAAPATAPPPTPTPSTAPADSASATPQPASSPTQSTPTTTPSAEEAKWFGAWTSASCGERKYERRITLNSDKTFKAMDLVSPCPPKVSCIWSGIVAWSGTWVLDNQGALLTKTSGGRDPTKKSNTDVPLRLVWDRAAAAPAEMSASGAPCPYAKSTTDNVAKP